MPTPFKAVRLFLVWFLWWHNMVYVTRDIFICCLQSVVFSFGTLRVTIHKAYINLCKCS